MTVSLKTAVVIVCLVGTLGGGASGALESAGAFRHLPVVSFPVDSLDVDARHGADTRTRALLPLRLERTPRFPRAFFAYPDYLAVLSGAEYVNTLYVEELFAGIHAELERAVEFVEAAQKVPAPVTQGPNGGNRAAPTGGRGGCCTQEQFARLAQCESGGVNGWRTGLYGIEAGYPIGGLSVAEQQAWVERIYAQHGPSAWGCGYVL